MATYKTPGVYVEEISTLPPSVADVATAVPAFIGYTEAGKKVARITTMLEYQTLFGGAQPSAFTVQAQTNAAGGVDLVSVQRTAAANATFYWMYYSLSLYFSNGGGACYIVSIGDYSGAPAKQDFVDGLAELEKEDEPTLILLTDAVSLPSADFYDLCQQVLAQCNKLGDRFGIFDVLNGDVDGFRNGIGMNYLRYGAAYHPYLLTTLTYQYSEDQVTISTSGASSTVSSSKAFSTNGIIVGYTGAAGDAPKVRIVAGQANTPVSFDISSANLLTVTDAASETGASIVAAWQTWIATNQAQGFTITQNGDGTGAVASTNNANIALDQQPGNTPASTTLAASKAANTALYNQVKTALGQQRVVMPPSSAIAGIYASVDRDRGVWKAPANVSVAAVIGPVSKITNDDQDNLNVDPTGGKSINAIRAFTGKGTLVWGARTLAGNDNEWRYVPVRRLFNLIEESTQKATAFAVFEPNDSTTWLKVKALIESYLYSLWEQGALAGAKPEDAYFVNVGLGKTMTSQDILEGRMIVEIGIAAVRPSEFIILRFTHKLQES